MKYQDVPRRIKELEENIAKAKYDKRSFESPKSDTSQFDVTLYRQSLKVSGKLALQIMDLIIEENILELEELTPINDVLTKVSAGLLK